MDIQIVDRDYQFDLALAGADLAHDDGLNTACILSLFCAARAHAVEIPPGADPRGWWGDHYGPHALDSTGSKLWLLVREKQLADVLMRAQEYAQAALAWLTADGVASSVDVSANFPRRGALGLAVTITRPAAGATFQREYQYVWEAYA